MGLFSDIQLKEKAPLDVGLFSDINIDTESKDLFSNIRIASPKQPELSFEDKDISTYRAQREQAGYRRWRG